MKASQDLQHDRNQKSSSKKDKMSTDLNITEAKRMAVLATIPLLSKND